MFSIVEVAVRVSTVLSFGVLIYGLSVISWWWWRLLSLPVYEVVNEGPEMGELVRKVDEAVPTVERTPGDDGTLYDFIFLLG